MAYKILCVDDDPTMLTTLRITLGQFFEVETADDASAGLQALKKNGPFAVILSDMKMPGMDGSSFLNEANYLAPDSVRVMLTGNRDQETAMRAVNEGHVFQLVTKPCDLDLLSQTIHAAVRQHQLITGERQLLEETLNGSVNLLTNILTLVDPAGFVKTTVLRDYIHEYLLQFGASTSHRWEVEMAAMLLNVGQVAIPRSLAEKESSGAGLSEAEKEMMERIPETGFGLLVNIPRLSHVAEIVRYQNKNYDGSGYLKDDLQGEEIPYGARLVRVLTQLIEKEASGLARPAACAALRGSKGIYDPKILGNCAHLKVRASPEHAAENVATVLIAELTNHHILVSPILTKEGIMIAPSGTEVSNLILEKVRNFKALHVLREPIQVKRRIR
jgi:response regulator RpfG family c-di-GMP phosphodiesterase